MFIFNYVLQTLGQLLVAFIFPSYGSMMLTISMLICGQYDILFCSLKNIRYTAMLMNSMKNRAILK